MMLVIVMEGIPKEIEKTVPHKIGQKKKAVGRKSEVS